MLEAILLGLISSGVYYVAQQHNDRLKEKEHQKVLNRKAIEADLKHGFQTFFPPNTGKISQTGSS